jgi:hypothetical protein
VLFGTRRGRVGHGIGSFSKWAQASAGHYDKAAAMTTGLLLAFMPCVERRRGRVYALFVVNHRPLEEGESAAQVELIAPRVLLTSGWSPGAMASRRGRRVARSAKSSQASAILSRCARSARLAAVFASSRQCRALPMLILLDHVGSFPQFGNAIAWINQEPATRSPKLGNSRGTRELQILGGQPVRCRVPMTKFWAIRFQPTALGQMPSICPRKSSGSFERLLEDHR